MHKKRPEIIHRQEIIHNPEFTPKLVKKQPIFHRRPLAGQQSANRPTRPQRPLLSSDHGAVSLSDEEVRSSAMYHMLEEEMRMMTNRHQNQLAKLKELKQEREKQLAQVQRQQFNTKMLIWELKNQVMDLKESIREEKEEQDNLTTQFGIENQPDGDPTSQNHD